MVRLHAKPSKLPAYNAWSQHTTTLHWSWSWVLLTKRPFFPERHISHTLQHCICTRRFTSYTTWTTCRNAPQNQQLVKIHGTLCACIKLWLNPDIECRIWQAMIANWSQHVEIHPTPSHARVVHHPPSSSLCLRTCSWRWLCSQAPRVFGLSADWNETTCAQ